jgi:hypothetical protein
MRPAQALFFTVRLLLLWAGEAERLDHWRDAGSRAQATFHKCERWAGLPDPARLGSQAVCFGVRMRQMGKHQIGQTERLARWICKALKPDAEIEIGEVHRLVAELDRRRVHVSRTWQQQIRTEAKGVPEAVPFALSKGWLANRDGRLSITNSGTEVARYSRAGPRKKRVSF